MVHWNVGKISYFVLALNADLNRNDGNHINSLIIAYIKLDTMNVYSWYKAIVRESLMYSTSNYQISRCTQLIEEEKINRNKIRSYSFISLNILQCFAIVLVSWYSNYNNSFNPNWNSWKFCDHTVAIAEKSNGQIT